LKFKGFVASVPTLLKLIVVNRSSKTQDPPLNMIITTPLPLIFCTPLPHREKYENPPGNRLEEKWNLERKWKW
jgi:hypothetical protein